MIKVLIDSISIKKIPDGAVSIHIFIGRLLYGISQFKQLYPVLALWRGMEEYWDNLAGFHVDKIVVNEKDKVTPSVKIDRIFALIPFEEELKKHGIKAVITPQYTSYNYIYPRKYNQHLIIHDLFAFRYLENETLWERFYKRLMLMVSVLRIPHIISISQTTKKDVLRYTHCDSDVVYNSIPFDFHVKEKPVPELCNRHYILDVNRFSKQKNTQLVIKAFSIIKDKIPHVLYLKGYKCIPEHYVWLENLVKEMGLKGRVIFDTTYSSESELRWLYTHADLFVTPSLDEGFGYTPIEAAILKTPVLISDIPTLKEVTQGKLESFDPHSPEELAEKMLNIISAPPNGKTLEKKADYYLKEYSLEAQIEKLNEVIVQNIEKE